MALNKTWANLYFIASKVSHHRIPPRFLGFLLSPAGTSSVCHAAKTVVW